MSHTEVQAFFVTYREAFNRLDGDAVADLWHVGSGIADSHGQGDGTGPGARLTWWPEDAPMRANHRALCELYRSQDYGRADFLIQHVQPLGPAHAFVHVQWTLQRRDGSLLQQFGTGYQLMHTAQGPRVLLAVAYQEDLQAMKTPATVAPQR
ncbi:MAG: hypothetical protein Q8M96_10495 [Rubrivivax sp.]|nr:hypothetical protein [Rubrivivax sp.]